MTREEHLKLRAIYSPDGSELRNRQLKMLEILKVLDEICVNNNISYFLSEGTALGAVRHGGFIPWDDDLDIEVDMKDFNRLMDVLSCQLPKWLALQTHKTDPYYWSVYAKVRDINSCINEKSGDRLNIDYRYKGVYIDIFPHEPSTYKLTHFSNRIYSNLVIKPAKKIRSQFIKKIICGTGRCFCLYVLFPVLRLFVPKDSDYYFSFGCFSGDCKRLRSDVDNTIRIDFEGTQFPVPHRFDSFLTNIYGDYMRIPEENERETHTEICKYQ